MARLRSLVVTAVVVIATLFVPTAARGVTTTIQDTAHGLGKGQVQFSAGWHPCTTTCGKAADNSYRWTADPGSIGIVRFTGSQITLFGVKEPWANIAAVTIDGAAPVDVDFYAATQSGATVEVYRSPQLTAGDHVLILTMTNRRNPASTGGNSITFDRADVDSGDVPGEPPAFWLSGGSRNTNTDEARQEWAAMRGRPVDLMTVYTNRGSSWAGFVDSHAITGQPAAYTDKSLTLLIQTPPFPEASAPPMRHW